MSREIPPTRRGYDAREVVSSLQKAIRRSDPDAAMYWAAELDRSGYGNWAWTRLRVICSEDCGPGNVGLTADVAALNEMWKHDRNRGKGGGLYFAHAVIALAVAQKSRVVDWALLHHYSDYVPRREVADEALDMHTLRGKRKGRGMQHFIDEASCLEPWTSSLDALEADYLEQARRRAAKDPDLPVNPWDASANVGTRQPAQNNTTSDSGQLSIASEDDR
jgi:hypothetical protein